ncbi:DUF6270 domain-containing protein [Bacillus wiedmannii]|uniref:DUF6270 domain-containing protein n=1 Tax=Bacillus wiedmannii TaxID=1890302 RepID=UPI000BEFC77D|nr:DUF6270 domain-containing protein [Bacillus wiedmannii]PEJ99344.1 hypothetical protein CN690_17510 [Bacillus wiedmannii]
MIKVAVLGSCVSRDSFNSRFISDYKSYATCVVHQNQMSMISLNSNPISYDEKLIDNLSPFDTKHFTTELNKSFFSEMIKHQPDYLIVDFYGDLYYGVQQIGDSYITNKKWLFQKTSQYQQLDTGTEMLIFFEHKELYLKKWKEGVKRLFDFLKENVPNCKVIVNKARFIDEYIDKETGEIKIISKSGRTRYINVPVYNTWWNALDNHVIQNYDVRVMDYGNTVYRSIEDHPWEMFYVHYDMSFYQDFSRKLLNIALEDTRRELETAKQSITSLEQEKKKKRMGVF